MHPGALHTGACTHMQVCTRILICVHMICACTCTHVCAHRDTHMHARTSCRSHLCGTLTAAGVRGVTLPGCLEPRAALRGSRVRSAEVTAPASPLGLHSGHQSPRWTVRANDTAGQRARPGWGQAGREVGGHASRLPGRGGPGAGGWGVREGAGQAAGGGSGALSGERPRRGLSLGQRGVFARPPGTLAISGARSWAEPVSAGERGQLWGTGACSPATGS